MKGPKRVVVDGVTTRYFEAGEGLPVVLFHGGGVTSSSEDWDECFDYFAKNFHVYVFDQLGFGYTDKRMTGLGLLDRVNHAASIMKSFGISRAHLVGYSQGGYVAARVALDFPELARTLVVGDSGTLAPMGNFASNGKITHAISLSHNPKLTKVYVRELYANLAYTKDEITDTFIEDRLAVASLPGNIEAAKIRANSSENLDERRRLDLSSRLSNFRLPTLIIWGKQDAAAPLSRGLKLLDLIPDADFHVFDKCGHNAMIDRRDEYVSLVQDFCKCH
ncbi:MAG: alpha/beta hydrolase [Nitrososphaerota archaeon]|nr:alpha/beta hydrolase [Nitrososphaerota archaeon]